MYYYTKNLKFLLAKLNNRFRISISRFLNKVLGLIQNDLSTEEKKDPRFRKNGVTMQAKQRKTTDLIGVQSNLGIFKTKQ